MSMPAIGKGFQALPPACQQRGQQRQRGSSLLAIPPPRLPLVPPNSPQVDHQRRANDNHRPPGLSADGQFARLPSEGMLQAPDCALRRSPQVPRPSRLGAPLAQLRHLPRPGKYRNRHLAGRQPQHPHRPAFLPLGGALVEERASLASRLVEVRQVPASLPSGPEGNPLFPRTRHRPGHTRFIGPQEKASDPNRSDAGRAPRIAVGVWVT